MDSETGLRGDESAATESLSRGAVGGETPPLPPAPHPPPVRPRRWPGRLPCGDDSAYRNVTETRVQKAFLTPEGNSTPISSRPHRPAPGNQPPLPVSTDAATRGASHQWDLLLLMAGWQPAGCAPSPPFVYPLVSGRALLCFCSSAKLNFLFLNHLCSDVEGEGREGLQCFRRTALEYLRCHTNANVGGGCPRFPGHAGGLSEPATFSTPAQLTKAGSIIEALPEMCHLA